MNFSGREPWEVLEQLYNDLIKKVKIGFIREVMQFYFTVIEPTLDIDSLLTEKQKVLY